MSTTPSTTKLNPKTQSTRKALIGAGIGNATEWYDYAVYGYLSVQLAHNFFPSDDPNVSLMLTFGAFAAAFLARPVGAVLFGSLGDRIGRQRTLAAVVLLIAVASFTIGILPTHETIGVAAPALLLVCRLLQGLSAGGEVGGGTSYIAEFAPKKWRGLACSWMQVSAGLGSLFAISVVLTLSMNLTSDQMNDWGWRIPFLLAGPLGLAGLFVRMRLEDSPAYQELQKEDTVAESPLREVFTHHRSQIVKVAGIFVGYAACYYLTVAYVPSTLIATHNFDSRYSYLATALSVFTSIIFWPLSSALSDRIGRRPVLMGSGIATIVLVYPIFVLVTSGNIGSAIVAQILLGALVGCLGGVPFVYMTEMFPTRVRYTGISIGYNIALTAVGGTAPLIATWLVSMTGRGTSPAWFIAGAALITTFTLFFTKETVNRKDTAASEA
ncbi:MFS transporter [Rhodococcus sp. NPDC060176]|uniref:MFS transporter n=1 Tax=Rhodococcus sp. NPDC060176 TaxID=3347062 RepID=UPI00364CEBC4